MGIGNWLGIGQEIATPVDAIGKAIDGIFTSDEERIQGQVLLDKLKASPYIAALQISALEAKSTDKWTSRARPMVLYSFCLVFVIDKAFMPLLWWLMQIFHSTEILAPPSLLGSDIVMTVIGGVLGTAFIASRGAEKLKGVAR